MRSVKTILKKVRVRDPSTGKTKSLGECLNAMSSDEMQKDIVEILNVTIERIKSTDDKRVLKEFYAIFLSLNIEKEDIVEIGSIRS